MAIWNGIDYGDDQGALIDAAKAQYSDPTKYSVLSNVAVSKYAPLSEFGSLSQIDPTLNDYGINVYDSGALSGALGNYTFMDPTKFGEDVFSSALKSKGTDLGDQFAIKASDYDYYKKLYDASQAAGLGNYGIGALADPLGEITGFNPNKWDIPVARFSTAAGDFRYIPVEFATELGKASDAAGGYATGIREFAGNKDLFSSGKLAMLPEEIAKTLSETDWAGSAYDLNNPGLGYVMTPEELGALYSKFGTAGAPDLIAPTFSGIRSGMSPYLGAPQSWAGTGETAGSSLRAITPELRAFLLDRGDASYEFGDFINMKASPEYMADVRHDYPWVQKRLDEINAADWAAIDPDNIYNMLLGDAETGSWSQPGLISDAGLQNISLQAQDWNRSNMQSSGFDSLLNAAGPMFASAVLGTMLGPAGMGFASPVSGALSSALTASMTGGDVLTSALTGGIGGAVGGIDSFVGADAQSLFETGLSTSQIADTLAQTYGLNPFDAYKAALAGSGAGAIGGVLTPNQVAGAAGQAATGIVTGADAETILGNVAGAVGGSAVGNAVGEADLGGAGSLIDQYAPGAASVATRAIIDGRDPTDALTAYFTSAGINAATSEIRQLINDTVANAMAPTPDDSGALAPGDVGEGLPPAGNNPDEATDTGAVGEEVGGEPDTELPPAGNNPDEASDTPTLSDEEVTAELDRVIEENPNIYEPPTQAELDAWASGDTAWLNSAIDKVVQYATNALGATISRELASSIVTNNTPRPAANTSTPQAAVSGGFGLAALGSSSPSSAGAIGRAAEQTDELTDAQVAELAAKLGVTPSEMKQILANSRKK